MLLLETSPDGLRFSLGQDAESDAVKTLREAIHQGLRDFNDAANPLFASARAAGDPQPLDIFLHDAAGELLGGATGSTVWGWLKLDILWVDKRARGQGLGARLLALAEAQARARGCQHVRLSTFDFQARQFYEKYGYVVVGEMRGFPPGGSFYWLRKDFPPIAG